MRIIVLLLVAPLMFLTACKDPESTKITQQGGGHHHDWALKNVDPAAAQEIMKKNPKIGILDVRTPAEFAEGHIEGAINIDFKASDFAEQISQVNNDLSYILYCRSGNRSGKALPLLMDNNFGTIYHLEKGFNAWKAEGLPVNR